MGKYLIFAVFLIITLFTIFTTTTTFAEPHLILATQQHQLSQLDTSHIQVQTTATLNPTTISTPSHENTQVLLSSAKKNHADRPQQYLSLVAVIIATTINALVFFTSK